MTPEERTALLREATRAVAATYHPEGRMIWWAHHDVQLPEEQIRLERTIILLAEGNGGGA